MAGIPKQAEIPPYYSFTHRWELLSGTSDNYLSGCGHSMLFREFSAICEQLEKISGRLDMIDLISRRLPSLSDEELPVFVRFIMGRIFPDWSPQKLGIGPNLLFDALTQITKMNKKEVIEKINKTGDVGLAVEEILLSKSQSMISSEDLDTLRGIPRTHQDSNQGRGAFATRKGPRCSPSLKQRRPP